MIWNVEFSQEASNYAIDSHPHNENVLIAIEQLAFNPDGLPSEGTYYDNVKLECAKSLVLKVGHDEPAICI